MAASNRDRGHYDAGTVERVLDEFRADHELVETLFQIHINEEPADALTVDDAEQALTTLKSTVCLALDRGNHHTEYLHYEPNQGWYSATETTEGTTGPIPVYEHNVSDRLGEFELDAAKVNHSPFATEELPAHDLDVDADGVMLDV